MLTPQEVSTHAFSKAVMGGYNMAMVDEFLDELTDDYTALYKENAALKAKLKVLVEKVEDYRATEDSMRATLLTAQKMADSIVHEAEAKREPFTSMIYMGDGLSDVPCMKMMRAYGGQAIAVYQASNRAGVEDLLAKGRVDYIFQADYRAGSALEATVQDIIRKMAVTDRLWEENARQVRSIGGDVLLGQVGLF